MAYTEPADEKTTGIMFKREITPGNVVSWALIVGGFVYGYSQLNSKVDNITESVRAINVTISELKNADNGLQAQINVMRDLNTTRQIDISTKMTRLETILERQEGKLDKSLMITPLPPTRN